MFALVLVCPAKIGATAVLRRHVVTDLGVTQGEIGVRSPATSAEEVCGLLSVTLSGDDSVDGGLLLHNVV